MQDKAKDLCIYRMNSALETLGAAKVCMESKHYKDAINRSYYAAFYIASKEDAQTQCESAENIIGAVKKYLDNKYEIQFC